MVMTSTPRCELGVRCLPVVLRFDQIDLVEGDDLHLTGQAMSKGGQLGVDGVEVFDRIGLRSVEQVNQNARAFDVAQKFVAQALAQAGSGDEAGNVGHDERRLAIEIDYAKIGLKW
jgi:hypothetical protein